MVDAKELDDQWKFTITKALSPDVSNRFQSASDFIKALKREVVIGKHDIKKVVPEDTTYKERKVGSGFDQIAGMTELKETLYNDVIRALHEKDLYATYGVSIPNGMLLYGPPGCGKTFIAQKFAEEVGFNFVMIKPSDLQSKYINETQENIGKLFREAEEQAPTILFFDELDALVPSREGELHHMHSSAVNEFLAQMTNCGEKGIFVVGATNRPDKIDTAVLRTGRLDKVVYLAPPDHPARRSMFELYLKNRPIDLGLNYDQLASITDNMVSSDIKFLVDEASRKALKVRGRITMATFDEVLRDTKPSVSLAEIRKYQALKQRWEATK
jgi:transitional endoplasmic reticulum ATPase